MSKSHNIRMAKLRAKEKEAKAKEKAKAEELHKIQEKRNFSCIKYPIV